MNTYHVAVPTVFTSYLVENEGIDAETVDLWQSASVLEANNQIGVVQYEGSAEELQELLDEKLNEPIVLETLTTQELVDYGYNSYVNNGTA